MKGEKVFTYADYAEYALPVLSDLREYYRRLSFIFVSETPTSVYPGDCGLNALRIGNKIYARMKSLAETVKKTAIKENAELKDVKQGYPACSVLKLTDKAAITSDRGMAKTLSEDGVEVLLIQEGYISLPPHQYGFIGGASFVYSNTVYFFGDLKSHPDNDKILSFVEGLGLRAVSLGEGALLDLGGALVFE